MEAPQIAHGSGADVAICGADGANVRRRWGECAAQMGRSAAQMGRSAAQMGFICGADVGICGADWTVFRRRFDVICGKVFSEPEDFSDRPFLLYEFLKMVSHIISMRETSDF